MLTAALIFVISVAAIIRFALFSWRAQLVRIACAPSTDEAIANTPEGHNLLGTQGLVEASIFHDICPDLRPVVHSNVRSVRFYYHLLPVVRTLSETIAPSLSAWTSREMALCTRYAAVVLTQRLRRNQACAAELRSF